MDDITYNAVLCRTKHMPSYSDVMMVLFIIQYTSKRLLHTKL
jgi:hypothetical protein